MLNWVSNSVISTNRLNTPMSARMPLSPYIECTNVSIGICTSNSAQPYQADFAVPNILGTNADDANTMSMLPRLTFLIPKVIEMVADMQLEELDSLSEEQLKLSVDEWVNDASNVAAINAMVPRDVSHIDLDLQEDLPFDLPKLPSTAYESVSKLFFGLSNRDETSQLLSFKDF